jgi:hypothetical protein
MAIMFLVDGLHRGEFDGVSLERRLSFSAVVLFSAEVLLGGAVLLSGAVLLGGAVLLCAAVSSSAIGLSSAIGYLAGHWARSALTPYNGAPWRVLRGGPSASSPRWTPDPAGI